MLPAISVHRPQPGLRYGLGPRILRDAAHLLPENGILGFAAEYPVFQDESDDHQTPHHVFPPHRRTRRVQRLLGDNHERATGSVRPAHMWPRLDPYRRRSHLPLCMQGRLGGFRAVRCRHDGGEPACPRCPHHGGRDHDPGPVASWSDDDHFRSSRCRSRLAGAGGPG
ncbi:hypothetical protein SMACR_06873 [Sordaria macrospora]|uniref:Uncharacterized protein n=1 Tax=Sordaria macrospora TaxID=5147 RepID=A0A8S8ZXG1_SORMA|nr:hypothetical protein SMACR_06873 [Sordaria macrospora]WPJ59602.1 hypothetical protein SMAC4_06873 [Sordaria macrospora]